MERNSKYWDDFQRRADETVFALLNNEVPPIRRVAIFITEACNFKCKYCNGSSHGKTMTEETFLNSLKKYGQAPIYHITGGEPSVVPWLYPLIDKLGDRYKFHLNTNAYITPPSNKIRRLKVSLDSTDAVKWNKLVGKPGAFNRVVDNIKMASKNTVTSITYTLSHSTYKDVINFAKFCNKEFPDLYAVFFSVYKGTNPNFVLTNSDVLDFFNDIYPKLLTVLGEESKALIQETIDEKKRLMQGERFKQTNTNNLCYLSMSERVFSPDGNEYTCSHLYRDGIFMRHPYKHEKCKYGCNQRLVQFNTEVQEKLKEE